MVLHRPQINDVGAARALDTVYQAGGRPILCLVTLDCVRGGDNQRTYGYSQVEDVDPPTDIIGYAGLNRDAGFAETAERIHCQLIFAVPAHYHYRIVSVVDPPSTIALSQWIEVTL